MKMPNIVWENRGLGRYYNAYGELVGYVGVTKREDEGQNIKFVPIDFRGLPILNYEVYGRFKFTARRVAKSRLSEVLELQSAVSQQGAA